MPSTPPSSPVNVPSNTPPIDLSSNINVPPVNVPSNTPPTTDPSSNTPPIDPSSNMNVPSTDPSSNTLGYIVTNQQYADASGNQHTETQFITTDPTSDVQITQDLSGNVIKYYADTNDSAKSAIIAQIESYAAEIQCSSFQGKGSIDDYAQLFQAAAQIANESIQMQLDVDVDGFNDFASAAEDLSALFTSFIVKLQNVSIIDDTAFLTAVANALSKIANLSKVFGKFKETILATSTVQIPKSAHETSVLIQNVSSQIDCAMKYITHFVDSTSPAPVTADLSAEEKGIINAAVSTIDSWNILCEQGVSIAMANDPDVQCINTVNQKLKQTTKTLSDATSLLKSKLSAFNLTH